MQSYTGKAEWLFRLPVLRHVMVRRFLDGVCDPFITRTDEIGDRFMRRVFLQIVHCARADAYELYAEVEEGGAAGTRDMESLTPQMLVELTKRVALYHAVVFWAKQGPQSVLRDLRQAAQTVFDFSEAEGAAFAAGLERGVDGMALFQAGYARELAAWLVRDAHVTSAAMAFTGLFLERSHEGFAKSFARYMPFGA